ncbi:MAG: YggT family protein [Candidatus Cloacimonetes bacterium]|nr:YggT family protein [Candidatus Cloacimonadota bacterium]
MSLLYLIDWLLRIYVWIIIIRAIISWFSPNYSNPFIHFLITVTEPVLSPIRRLIPIRGIDISPIIVILIIEFIRRQIFYFIVKM